MLTHRLARTPLPSAPSTRLLPPRYSPSLVPSFWRLGSSDLAAVCVAQRNVSSTRRENRQRRRKKKMGQNIRTARCTCSASGSHRVRSESDRRVLSYPLPCSMFRPLLTARPRSLIIDDVQLQQQLAASGQFCWKRCCSSHPRVVWGGGGQWTWR